MARLRAAAVVLALALPASGRAQVPVPQLTGPVVDTAGLLDASDRRRLEDLARSARARENGEGVQLQYLIVPTLGGEPIEDFSIRVAEAWKIGSKGRDNGILVTVPPTSWTNSLVYHKQPKAQFTATTENASQAPAVKFTK